MENAVLVIVAILAYLMPWMIADIRNHANLVPIALVNVFFGWTLLGWFVALVWSTTSNVKIKPAA